MNMFNQWYRASERERGFSMVEIMLGLVVFAAVTGASIHVVQNKLEDRAVATAVSDLTTVAEGAYECFVRGGCKDTTTGGWRTLSGHPYEQLKDKNQQALLSGALASKGLTITTSATRAVVEYEVGSAERARRVSAEFDGGSPNPSNPTRARMVLGVPGTERAFTAAIDKTVADLKGSNFVFSTKSTIENASDVRTDQITIDGVRLTGAEARALLSLAKLNCSRGVQPRIINGVFTCIPPRQAPLVGVSTPCPPAPSHCGSGQTGTELRRSGGTLYRCTVCVGDPGGGRF